MKTNSIDISSLNQRLSKKGSLTLLDVRRKSDYEAFPKIISGALWRDPETIDQWIGELPIGVPAVAYCVRGGSVSQSIVDRLRSEGINAMFLEGGLKAWMGDGQSIQDV